MFDVLCGVLLFAAVCGIGLLIAFAVQHQMKRSGQKLLWPTEAYSQYIQDKYALNSCGYAQQLNRSWSSFGSFCISFTTMSILAGSAMYFGPVFSLGGAWAFSIGWPIVSLFAIIVAAAVSELASAIPTSGGVYHWALAAGGKKWGWGAAWLRGFGDAGLLILINWAGSSLIDSILSGSLEYERGSGSLLLIALLLFASQLFIAKAGKGWLSRIIKWGTWLQVLLIVVIVGGMAWIIGPHLQPAEYLFAFGPGGTGEGGFLQVLLTLLLLHRIFMGGDAAAHAVEEIHNPSVNAPWSIFLTAVYGFVFGYVLLAFIALTTTDAMAFYGKSDAFLLLISDVWGAWNPLMNMLITAGVIAALWGNGLGVLNSGSRLWFAYLRDSHSHIGRWLSAVSTTSQTPVRVILVLAGAAYAGLVVLLLVMPWTAGSSGMLWFLTGWSTLCMNLALAIPLGLLLLKPANVRFGERIWHLGRFSTAVRWIAFLWLISSALAAAIWLDRWVFAVLTAALLAVVIIRSAENWLPGSSSTLYGIKSREELLKIERQYKQQ
ncbi:APC family permease [Paenibacillus abyssi]|uniref:Amino acid permease n=1 Tax=Paenibacillus abyssi TaxID=1340531 RepID=A0A917FMV3_9BACL|nr:APC family permease [Paenibacillus abyssi]GGF90121.1 hypothetical protein GCM10010916_04370 [Paenibacillus abyssi]